MRSHIAGFRNTATVFRFFETAFLNGLSGLLRRHFMPFKISVNTEIKIS
ncbi:hypothetical protein HMPREF9123_1233 [Neisseria bacilliformis ATCC BAA-1200]|uniref:Uncharacterized protein n=1 Tax=Neisseria bacilliformis ATCC BAA-1200 TaxID=888742 RepID=F2BBX8_9NEIS|nr:hypothetical protein HMPREF9123_1233 [Neisseria bacilliformis ATCC BAA-1200]